MRIPTIILSLLFTICLYGQEWPETEIKGAFAAVIVEDMDVSVEWYMGVLELEKVSETDLPERGLRQINLKNEYLQVELIQLSTAASQAEALESLPDKKRIAGLFKFGFKVNNFDYWRMILYKRNSILLEDIVKDPISGKRTVVFKDPDGNRIQIFEN